ncbi:MAG: hypothetical protein PHG04_00735 [Candidatus Nanoarchaeia archaeon]|nr:hypothetical protein [Candidatus Nanoarchaeia archaeon]
MPNKNPDFKKCELKNIILTHRSSTSPYFILSINKEPINQKTLEEKLSFDFTTMINGLMNVFQDMSGQMLNNEIYDIKMKSKGNEKNLYRYLLSTIPDLKDATSDEIAGKIGLMSTAAGNRFMLYCNFKSKDNKSFDQYDGILKNFVDNVASHIETKGLSDMLKYACLGKEERCEQVPQLLIDIIDNYLPKNSYCYVTIANHTFRNEKNLEPIYNGDKYALFKEQAENLKMLLGRKTKKYKDFLGKPVYEFMKEFSSCHSVFKKFNNEKLKKTVDIHAGDIYFIMSNPLYLELCSKQKALKDHLIFCLPLN